MDNSRKGSIDVNPSPTPPTEPAPPPDIHISTPNSDIGGKHANGSSSDMMVPPKANQGKAMVEDAKAKKTWRASGSVVQQKLVGWKPDDPLDLSHLNLDSIPKPLLKGDHYLPLKHLNLSSNKLSSIPPQIALLKSLVTLDCMFNRISDLPVELGDLMSLEFLQLSGNPLNKDLMQRHLLGTASILQYLRERQAAEQGKVRKSNKFKPLKSSSDPSTNPTDARDSHYARTFLSPPVLSPPQGSPLTASDPPSASTSGAPSPRNPLSTSDNAINKKPPPLTHRRPVPSPRPITHSPSLPNRSSLPSPTIQHSPSLPIPSPTPATTPHAPTPLSQTPPLEPRGDMGPIITQLKFGIIYTETVRLIEPQGKQRAASQGSADDYAHNYNGTGTLMTSSTLGTKEKFLLRDAEGRFTFNNYCTNAFSELRTISDVSQDRYLAALESISALGFAGKSGSVLLKSVDGLLVLKTISKDEASFLRKIMPQILTYVKANPKTYLTRFWGLYKVLRSPIEKVNFVVMKNAFYTTKKIHERYDLKGSTVGRTTDEENVRRSRIVLKDLNFNRQLKLGPERSKVFLAQIEKDTEFLQKFDIIDYSLIVGVHYLSETPTKDPKAEYPIEGEIQAMDKDSQLIDEIYFINIIDMLQPYNIRKQMEYGIKSIRYGTGISVIPPENYAARFLNFIISVVE